MIGIAQKVARNFSDAVRSRGQSYFIKGRVSVMAARPGEVVAKVRGTSKYRVRLRMRGSKLLASCTCPYFSPQGEPCKHLWATLLMAEARGMLQSAPVFPIQLVTESPRRTSPVVGLPEVKNSTGAELEPGADPFDLGMGLIEPGPPRPAGLGGPGARMPKTRGKDRGMHREPGGDPGSWSQRGPTGRHYRSVAGGRSKNKLPGSGQAAGSGAARTKAVNRNAKRLLVYVLDVAATLTQNQVVVDLARRQRKTTGEWGPLRPWYYAPHAAHVKYDPEDRLILALLDEAQGAAVHGSHPSASPGAGSAPGSSNGTSGAGSLRPGMVRHGPASSARAAAERSLRGMRRFVLRKDQAGLVERLARTGRLRLRRTDGEEDPPTVRWDDGQPWRFSLDIRAELGGKRWAWRGSLRRGEHRMDLSEPLVLLPGLLVLGVGRAARFDDLGVMPWIQRLRYEKEITFVEPQQDLMLGRILAETRVPPLELVESLRLEEINAKPRPSLTLRTPRQNWGLGSDKLIGELEFDYDGAVIPAGRTTPLAVSTELGLVIRRDPKTESSADVKLFELGFREAKDPRLDPGTLELPAKRMSQVTKDLVAAGWRVEAEGKLIRPAGEFKMALATGIDWFELGGGIQYGDQNVSLPDLLAAAKRGESMIELGDGSMGMLPEEWLKKYGMLADLATVADGNLRFNSSQAGMLDALLAAQPEIQVDAAFEKVRQNLRQFEGVVAVDSPAGFHGELRPYQREGLGWLDYLQRFGFGGILADDMGLGKTIQVLALLQRRRTHRQAKGPSLAVVPRSLVFNWMQEAAKFTPRLRVLDYTGPGRHSLRGAFTDYDLIITTYGTVRTDIAELTNFQFDYAILDEAQAIKNAESQSAKAARLLRSRYKLAISGTPIENHLGELWSIFEFLNPGMLGSDTVFKRYVGGGSSLEQTDRVLLAKALRPFILRRTKQQVVEDLPEKTEQTLYCDMEAEQRRCYDELRAHYRDALLRKDTAELNRSKIEVLEALLRLRQAACHPGLINPDLARGDSSAKLEMLVPSITEVVEEGHKVLVFSQFTSFLAIVRDRLDEEKIVYEYLDGRTRNRAAKVERFQTDDKCPVFLISLKAGGLGLNLTAAEYVYLLDPWWNPAVEAQAIDRSHRIGQTQHVFAYRLICRGTVEEKILELQQKKRDLADAILSADNRGAIQNLTREDIEFLLS